MHIWCQFVTVVTEKKSSSVNCLRCLFSEVRPPILLCFHGPTVLWQGLHLKLHIRNVYLLIKSGWNSVPWYVFPTPAPSLPSEGDVWLKLGYATLREDTRNKNPTNLKRKYKTEFIFLVLSEIEFRSIQYTGWLDLYWDMFKPKSIQEWNKEGWLPTFSPSHFFVNKNTGFSPNIQDQHLYPISFASEVVSLFSAQVNVQVFSKDKQESNQTNLSTALFKAFVPWENNRE